MDPSLYPLAALQMQYNNPGAAGIRTPVTTADANDQLRQQMMRGIAAQQMQTAGNISPTSSPTMALARAMGGVTGPMMMRRGWQPGLSSQPPVVSPASTIGAAGNNPNAY